MDVDQRIVFVQHHQRNRIPWVQTAFHSMLGNTGHPRVHCTDQAPASYYTFLQNKRHVVQILSITAEREREGDKRAVNDIRSKEGYLLA